MFVTPLRRLGEAGDTLVEVLMAIAVLGLALAGAFVTTNHSLLATRGSQERENGMKLVESQLEQVKNLASTNANAVFGAGVPASFCVNSSGAVVSSANASCTVDASGVATTAQPAYHLAITRNVNTFTITNRWTDVSGRQQDSVQMTYRVYQQ
ncbi:MAG TPA: hypothetical protein VIR03_01745 [Candidatus Saccharimonadales bacterium]